MLESSHGGIGRPQLWTTGQRRLWLFALFMLLLLLYASRTALPIAIVKIAEEREWNKRTSVSVLYRAGLIGWLEAGSVTLVCEYVVTCIYMYLYFSLGWGGDAWVLHVHVTVVGYVASANGRWGNEFCWDCSFSVTLQRET